MLTWGGGKKVPKLLFFSRKMKINPSQWQWLSIVSVTIIPQHECWHESWVSQFTLIHLLTFRSVRRLLLSRSDSCCVLLSACWGCCDGCGCLDFGWKERLHQPSPLYDICCLCLHTGPRWSYCHGNRRSGMLCHLQGAEKATASGKRLRTVHLYWTSTRQPKWQQSAYEPPNGKWCLGHGNHLVSL